MCLGAFFERQKQRQNLGGGHPAGVVLEAGGAPGEADEPVPWTLRQGRELDLAAARMGTLPSSDLWCYLPALAECLVFFLQCKLFEEFH